MFLKQVDLHIHLLQSLYPEDLFEMAKDIYHEIDWNRFSFLDRYEKIMGVRLNPNEIFEHAIKTNSISEIEDICTYKYSENGKFEEFDIKSFFPLCITGYYFDKNDHITVLKPIVERHKKEGIHYIEYRHGFYFSYYEEWALWHLKFIHFFKEASTDDFQIKYIMRIHPSNYKDVKRLLSENPDIRDIVVGVDFSGREISPVDLKDFYDEINEDRREDPMNTLDVVVHIGEDFYDKSLESAIRWCHQSALFGAKRLGHCIALGLDPHVAVSRKPQAHEYETVKERIDQILYDLQYENELQLFGIEIDRELLLKELNQISEKKLDELIHCTYDNKRLDELVKRQDYVLRDLKRIGTIIETCPSSNLCIGGVPNIHAHPFKKLYNSGVNLVICSDDPGIFSSSIADEVDFVGKEFNLPLDELQKSLKNPYQFRLKNGK